MRLEHLNVLLSSIRFFPHEEQCLVVLGARVDRPHTRVASREQILLFHLLLRRWLNPVPRALLLVIILCVSLRLGQGLDAPTNLFDLRDEVHVVPHDLQVVCLVDLTLDL